MTFFEFLETYYIWLLVVVVILIITIIGYLADRRDKKRKLIKDQNGSDAQLGSNANLASTMQNQEQNTVLNQQQIFNGMVNQDGVQPMVNSNALTPNVEVASAQPVVSTGAAQAVVSPNVEATSIQPVVNQNEILSQTNDVQQVNPQLNIINGISNIETPNSGVQTNGQSSINNNFESFSEPTSVVVPVLEPVQVDSAFKIHEEVEVPLEMSKLDDEIRIAPVVDTQNVVSSVDVASNNQVVNTSTPVEPMQNINVGDEFNNNFSNMSIPQVEDINSNRGFNTPPIIEPLATQKVSNVQKTPDVVNLRENADVNSGIVNMNLSNEVPSADSINKESGIVNSDMVNTNTADNFEDDIWKL